MWRWFEDGDKFARWYSERRGAVIRACEEACLDSELRKRKKAGALPHSIEMCG